MYNIFDPGQWVFMGGFTLVGRVINPASLGEIEYWERAAITVSEEGRIEAIDKETTLSINFEGVLIPGLVDCHLHAPQWVNLGRGYNVPLLEWLDRYTFPTEAAFADDPKLAEKVYEGMVRALLANGTTCACYFGSRDNPANVSLVRAMERHGQRGFVGRVCMDCNTPAWYCDGSPEESIAQTREFIASIADSQLVKPIVTPRFAVSCSLASLQGLGRLAKEMELPVQSHLGENDKEIEFVASLFPHLPTYAHVYGETGLLGPRTIMAHCVHLQEAEIELLLQTNTAIAHCPSSNFNLNSGVAPIRKLLERGLRVGLGTDISGGSSPSILDAMRQAIIASKMIGDKPFTFEEVFYLGTKGGAMALNRPDLGHFAPGNPLDALLFTLPYHPTTLDLKDSLEILVNSGNASYIQRVFVGGREIASSP